jgi:hypothetical protein
MIGFLRRLFGRSERHYPRPWNGQGVCVCGYTSAWDYHLHRHFEEQGRIGK